MEITPKQSFAEGVTSSIIVGILTASLLCVILKLSFGTGLVGIILFLPVAVLTGLALFFVGWLDIPFQMVGAGRTFGHVNGKKYQYGRQWVNKLFGRGILITPGPEQEFSVEMPSDSPEAKDKIEVIIGEKTPCVLQVRVFDPILYAGAVNRDKALASSFGNQVRLFINQMNYAPGIIDEKSLLEDFIELPVMPLSVPRDFGAMLNFDRIAELYTDLWCRLSDLKISRPKPDGTEEPKRVFDEKSVNTIMDQAGVFRKEAADWGMHVFNIFAPSIDLPEEIEEAAVHKQAQMEESERLQTKMDNIESTAKKLKTALEITGEDALDRVGLATDQKVTRTIYGIPGLREGIVEAAGIIAKALIGKGGSAETQQGEK